MLENNNNNNNFQKKIHPNDKMMELMFPNLSRRNDFNKFFVI